MLNGRKIVATRIGWPIVGSKETDVTTSKPVAGNVMSVGDAVLDLHSNIV
jgi:hypothetical protein